MYRAVVGSSGIEKRFGGLAGRYLHLFGSVHACPDPVADKYLRQAPWEVLRASWMSLVPV